VFAEVYGGRTIAPGQDFVTTLAELFRLKLQLLDNELHHRNPSWLTDRELSLRILSSLVPAFLAEVQCSYERFAEAVRDCLTPLGITVENAAALLERSAKDYGLIEVYTIPTGPMTPDRIVDRPDVVQEFRHPWNPTGIAPTPDLAETRQPDRGIQWLERAAWPDPANWFTTVADEPIMLAGFLSTKDHAVGIQIAVWGSCVAVPRALVHLIERDVGFDPSLWTSSFSVHEIKGHFGGGVYAPLRLAVWAPWVTDGEPEMWHTLSDSGEPVAIPMIPLVTESHWRGTSGETSAQSPTKFLRAAGGIVDCRGTDDAMQFVGRDRMEIAYFQRLNFPDEWGKSNRHLEINRTKFFQALDQQDLVPVWGIRGYRELLPELRPKGFVDQTSYWLVTSEDSGASFRSVLINRVLQDKRKS
jgi:hypothetical protein